MEVSLWIITPFPIDVQQQRQQLLIEMYVLWDYRLLQNKPTNLSFTTMDATVSVSSYCTNVESYTTMWSEGRRTLEGNGCHACWRTDRQTAGTHTGTTEFRPLQLSWKAWCCHLPRPPFLGSLSKSKSSKCNLQARGAYLKALIVSRRSI